MTYIFDTIYSTMSTILRREQLHLNAGKMAEGIKPQHNMCGLQTLLKVVPDGLWLEGKLSDIYDEQVRWKSLF